MSNQAQLRHDADNTSEDMRLENMVCFALYAASNLISGLYRPALARLGLTYPQYLVLLVLWESSPQTVGSLGQHLYLDSGTLTPLLKRMETAGLITRRRDPRDERRVLIALTETGVALRTPVREATASLGSGASFPLAEAEALRDGARNLIATLTKAHPPVESKSVK